MARTVLSALAGFLSVALFALAAQSAIGAPYTVKPCEPGGSGVGEGWQFELEPGSNGIKTDPVCNGQPGSSAAFFQSLTGPQGTAANGQARVLVNAPAGTTIKTFHAQVISGGPWNANALWIAGVQSPTVLFELIAGNRPLHDVDYVVNRTQFQMTLWCVVPCTGTGNGDSTFVEVLAPALTFEDPTPPAVSIDNLPTAPVQGTIDLHVHATDAGGGVKSVLLFADGVQRAIDVDDNGGRCVAPYKWFVPCSEVLEHTFQFDTTLLQGNGPHTIRAVAIDAAGQQGEASASIDVENLLANTVRPKLSGSAETDSELSTTSGEWSGLPATSFAFQWLRCDPAVKLDSEAGCAPIAAAGKDAYVANAADVGKRLVARVTATNPVGPRTALSAPSAVVTAPSEGGTPAADRVAPKLTAVKLSSKSFRAGLKKASVLRWSVTEAGKLSAKVAPAKARGKAKLGKLALSADVEAGAGRRVFTGSLRGKPLPPGPYVMTVTATDLAGNVSAPVKLRFTVLPPKA